MRSQRKKAACGALKCGRNKAKNSSGKNEEKTRIPFLKNERAKNRANANDKIMRCSRAGKMFWWQNGKTKHELQYADQVLSPICSAVI